MAVKVPVALTESGPDGNASWHEIQFDLYVPAATIDTTGIEHVMGIVPAADQVIGGGQPNVESLPAGNAIGRLVSARVSPDADFGPNADLTLVIFVYQQGDSASVWGTQFAFGWASNDVTGIPGLHKFISTLMPPNSGNTQFGPNLLSGIPVFPGMVVTAKLIAFDDTVAWPGGNIEASFV